MIGKFVLKKSAMTAYNSGLSTCHDSSSSYLMTVIKSGPRKQASIPETENILFANGEQ